MAILTAENAQMKEETKVRARAQKLLRWLQEGWIHANTRIDQTHLLEWLGSDDITVVQLGLSLYDRLDTASPRQIITTETGRAELARLREASRRFSPFL